VFKPFGPDVVTGATMAPANPAAVGEAATADAGFRLLPVHPNPATESVSIPFTILRAGRVLVEVVDASGRSIGTLADREFEPGDREISWNPGGLAAGMYFVRMRSGNERAVRSVTLLASADQRN
jgi:hypothetical protein